MSIGRAKTNLVKQENLIPNGNGRTEILDGDSLSEQGWTDYERLLKATVQKVRNPLTSIYLTAELLEFSENDHERKKYIGFIKRSATRINELLTELTGSSNEK